MAVSEVAHPTVIQAQRVGLIFPRTTLPAGPRMSSLSESSTARPRTSLPGLRAEEESRRPSASSQRDGPAGHGPATQPSPTSSTTPLPSSKPAPPRKSVSPRRTTSTSTGSHGPGGQVCSNCETTRTPLWRRSPQGAIICNACGLYLKARNASRPTNLKRPPNVVASTTRPAVDDLSPKPCSGAASGSLGASYVSAEQMPTGTCPGGGSCNGTGGAEGCSGCPTYNNLIAKTASLNVLTKQAGEQADKETSKKAAEDAPAPVDIGAQDKEGNSTVVIACQNCGTTVTPLWRRGEGGHTICNACGLFYKLHGVHRPVIMRKSIIKRRKRVAPGPADAVGESTISLVDRTESASPGAPEASSERGSLNADGSVNLGLRRRPDNSLKLVPESLLRQNRQSPGTSGTDLMQYHSSHTSQPHDRPVSVSEDNRLAPLTSLTATIGRPSSLSPASFLSPQRKRSFSATEPDTPPPSEHESSKRLSSIKSILNPSGDDDRSRSRARYDESLKTQTMAPLPSPGLVSNDGDAGTSAESGAQKSGKDVDMADDGCKEERKEALRREAERMREMLAANQRALEELENE